MRISYLKVLVIIFIVSLAGSGICRGELLTYWNDYRAYRPIPVEFIHGMNSSPEAWGFQIDPATESVTGYTKTSMELRKYFEDYLDHAVDANGNPIIDPDTGELIPLPYLEPFNYSYNTFDAVEWNSYEGYNNSGAQYSDPRIVKIAPEAERPTLRLFQEGGSISNVSGSPVTIGGIFKKYTDPQTGGPPKTNLVAHSLGGIVSRYYINKTQGVNVKQLTTLGTPHKGTLSATLADIIVINPITDPSGQRRIWRIRFFSLFIKGIDVNRKPNMIDELKLSSQFIRGLNSSIPNISRYYCIGGRINRFFPLLFYTDGFIELESALASKNAILPSTSSIESFLPNYKGKILFSAINPMENFHTELPNKWEEILKAIDPAGRVDITEPKDGFTPLDEGELIVKGRVYDEYLPADCKLKVEVLLKGEMEEKVIDNPNPEPGEPAWVWRLQPTDLWRVDDPDSPVAEFEIHIPAEYAMKVEKVKVIVTNPSGYTYEDEVTWNLLIVDEGTKEVYCLDGPMTMRTDSPVITNEFRLVDEEGNKIESRPLGVAWDDALGIFYVSFDDKKIRAYNEYGELVKTNSGRGYLEVPEVPDGLGNPFSNGYGAYVSEVASIYRNVSYFNDWVYIGVAEGIHLLYTSPDYQLVKVHPTDVVWEYIPSPGNIRWYSSKDLGLARFGSLVTSDSIPLGFSPTGLVQRRGSFYLVSSDGRLYQKYCESALKGVAVSSWLDEQQYIKSTAGPFRLWGYYDIYQPRIRQIRSFVSFSLSELPEEFQSVKIPMVIIRWGYLTNAYLDVVEGWNYDDIFWGNQPDVLYSLFSLTPIYSDYSLDEVVIDVTDAVRDRLASGEKTLDIRCSINEEGDTRRMVIVYLGPMYVEETTWAVDLPTGAPSDLGLGGKLRMRIKPGYPTSVNVGDIIQLEAHGKEPLVWQSSDESVGKVDSNGLFAAVGKGTCTVTVQDALRGNTATSGVITVMSGDSQ